MEPQVSLCMIVKNEEGVLARCLDSVVGIVDEIIVVDTGSDDKTKEIALRYTDLVFDFKWDNDFSKARNFAASKASGEWIFVLDADEYVDRESFEKFKPLLDNCDENIFAVEIINFVGAGARSTVLNTHDRIYRNDGSISYFREIHENLKHKDGQEKRGVAPIQIFHSGYMSSVVEEKKKSDRNLKLLKSKKTKDAIDYFYLGNEYSSRRDWEQAIRFYQRAYQLAKDKNVRWVSTLLVNLIHCLISAERYEEALTVVSECERVYTQVADFLFLKGRVLFEKGELKKSAAVFEKLLSNKTKLNTISSLDALEYLPHKYLGEIYEREKELQLAVHHFSKSLSANDSDDNTWIRLIGLLAKHSPIDELKQFIQRKCLSRSSMTEMRMIKILLDTPILQVQKLSREFAKENLAEQLKELITIKNLFLDGKTEAVDCFLKQKNEREMISLLSHGIFSFRDFILFTLATSNENYIQLLNKLKVNMKVNHLLNLLFGRKYKKLSSTEENLFISLYKQAQIMELDHVVEKLVAKKASLSVEAQRRLKKELKWLSA